MLDHTQRPVALYYRILRYGSENIERLHELFDLRLLEDPRADTAESLKDVEVLFAPLGFPVDRQKMDLCPKLKVIVSNTTGIPHIDKVEAERRGVFIAALHDKQAFLDTITPTAELTVGLMLAAWRRIPAAHRAATQGRWDRRPWGAPRMFSRMRLGLVGYGRLGRKVAEIAGAMRMDIAFYDPHVEGGVPDLMALARRSDVLSLHAAVTGTNKGIVSRRVLEALPKGAMIINTARGELLDTEAMLDLLEEGHLFAAALDTIDGEYDPAFSDRFADSRLARYAREHDNLILTPHIGGSTFDAWAETERRVIDDASRFLGCLQ